MDINKLDKNQLHDLADKYHEQTSRGGYYLHQMIETSVVTMQEKWDNFLKFIKELN